MTKLLDHFKRMQGMAGTYLEPGGYLEHTPPKLASAGAEDFAAQATLFASDMLYMLDGPEQRKAQAEADFDFVAESMVTCSNKFHGEKVGITDLLNALQDFSAAAERLDRMKKALFYGRDYISNPTRPQPSRPSEDEQAFSIIERIGEQIDKACEAEGERPWPSAALEPLLEQSFHAILGVATESGEMIDAWLQAYKHNKPVDFVNLREEFGDNQWYVAIMLDALGKLVGGASDFESLHRLVNRKLRARFPDGFNEFDANNRDLVGERRILEGDTFDTEEVAAGQDVFSARPDYDVDASRNAVEEK